MSSIHKREDTGKFVVRWREGGRTGRQRSRSFDRERDAKLWRSHVDRLAQLGQLAQLDAGKVTLGEFVEQYWQMHAIPNLAPRTRKIYLHVWSKHAHPRLASYRLRDITPAVMVDFRAQLARQGVGDPTIIKTLTMLQGVFSFAVLRDAVAHNPVDKVKKPPQTRTREPVVASPQKVELLRRYLLEHRRRPVGVRPPTGHSPRLRDATMVSVLAYAGPRPGEQLALQWRHVQRRVIRFYAPKTKRERTVRILGPLAEDLAKYRASCGNPDDAALVFPRADGAMWVETDWRNWRADVFYEARDAVGLSAALVPYDLRHSFVSLLIAEGQSVLEVARQAGHSPQTCLRTYAHLFDEYDPTERVSAEEQIRKARDSPADGRSGASGQNDGPE